MRITPDPFASSSRHPTPSSSTASLNTLVKDDPRSFAKTTRQTKATQDPSQKPPALRVQSVSYAAAPPCATPPYKATAPERLTTGNTLLSVEIADAVKLTPIAAKHLSGAWTPSPTSDFLTIDTHQKPLWRSQSSDGLSSPNQLEGIVIDSLKTPIQGAHGFLGATTCNTTIAGRPMDKAKGFAGEVFEAEHDSTEQYGVPWMLYRHKSRSTGTIPCTHGSTSLEAASAMETGAVVMTRAKATKESDTCGAHPAVPAKKGVLTRPARAKASSEVSTRNDAGTVASTALGSCDRLPIESAVKPLPELKGNTECAVKELSESAHTTLHRAQRRDPGTAGGKRQPSARRNQVDRSDSQLLTDETDLQPAIETIRSQQTMQSQQTVKLQQTLQSQNTVSPQQTMQSQQTTKSQQTIQAKRTDKPQHTVEPQQIVKSQQIAERQYTVNHVQIVELQQTVNPQQKDECQQTAEPQQKVERPQTAKLQPTIESYSSPPRPGKSEVNDATIDLKADAQASAILAVSTAHSSTALGHVQDQNGAAQHQSNHSSIHGHFRRAQQLYSRHIDMGMDASSPSTLFSHNSDVHSPALSDTTTSSSNHTESTFVSETFSTSSRTDSTTTGTSSSSHSSQTTRTITRWSTTPSSLASSDTASSVASTLYHHPHHYDHHHHHNEGSVGFVRGYITRTQEMATSVFTATGTATSGAFSRVHRLFQTNRISIIFASNPSASSSSPPSGAPPSSSSPPEITTTQPSRSNPKIQPDKVPWWRFYHDGYRTKQSSPSPPTPPSSSSLAQPQGPNGHRYIPAPYARNGRKGPKRPDEKTFFSNERTFMHWIKFALLLGSMALTLCSFGQEVGLGVGLFLVTVAMSTLVYATTIYHLRHRWMTRARFDVKYYDRVGPSVLFLALFMAYAINVGLSLHKLLDKQDEGLNFYNTNGPMDI